MMMTISVISRMRHKVECVGCGSVGGLMSKYPNRRARVTGRPNHRKSACLQNNAACLIMLFAAYLLLSVT